MIIKVIYNEYMRRDKMTKEKQRKYFWAKVEFVSGKKRWYWCPPKLTKALDLEKDLRPTTYQDSLIGNYIVIAYKDYGKGGQEHLTLAKVLKLQRSDKRTYSWHQTRSQFLTPDNIGTRLGYHYIRHDYNVVTRLHLLITNYIWGMKLKPNGKKKWIKETY